MAALLAICQTALRQIGQFNVPTSIVGNTDPTAVQLLALANLTGERLCKQFKWQALINTHTFATVASTVTYALPSDYGKFANITFWNRSQSARMEGPVSNIIWQALNSGNLAAVGGVQFFRIAANLFAIFPTPTSIETIAYEYYSNQWITGKSAFSDDADVPLIDSNLFILDVRWRFLQGKGLPYESERADFEDALSVARGDDGAKDMIRFGSGRSVFGANIPETGVGA